MSDSKKKTTKKAVAPKGEKTPAEIQADAVKASVARQKEADDHPDAARPRRDRLADRKAANTASRVPGVGNE